MPARTGARKSTRQSRSQRKQQTEFFKTDWKTRYAHGGELRKKRAGRTARPLSTKHSLHLVMKADRSVSGFASLRSPTRFNRVMHLIQKYSLKFHVKLEQFSIQGDHIHLLIHAGRRTNYQSFFRVVAGQIAQQLGSRVSSSSVTDTPRNRGVSARVTEVTDTPRGRDVGGGVAGVTDTLAAGVGRRKFWLVRPFTRVLIGRRSWRTVADYIQLNEKEALGEVAYRKERLRGLSEAERRRLWT